MPDTLVVPVDPAASDDEILALMLPTVDPYTLTVLHARAFVCRGCGGLFTTPGRPERARRMRFHSNACKQREKRWRDAGRETVWDVLDRESFAQENARRIAAGTPLLSGGEWEPYFRRYLRLYRQHVLDGKQAAPDPAAAIVG